MKSSLRAMLAVGVPLFCLVTVFAATLVVSDWGQPRAVAAEAEPKVPFGLPPVFFPEDNLYSAAKVELGRLLYFDKRLSTDNTVSCASCHSPSKGYTDGAPVSTGIKGHRAW